MRETLGPANGLHNHGKHQVGHPVIADMDRMSSPTSYHQSPGTKHLSMAMPRTPLTQSHLHGVEVCTSNINEPEVHATLTAPSPISPRSTRCPSLTDSLFTAGTCTSPIDSEPRTPTSDHSSGHAYPARHGHQRSDRLYDGGNSRYQRGRSSSPSASHRELHQSAHLHSQPLSTSMSTARIQHCMDPDTPMASENHENNITKQEKRRRNHLNSEKRRRENIKGGMDALVDLVPSCRNIQESKANILKKAKEYIYQLINEVKRVKDENQELRRLLALHSPQHHLAQSEDLVYRGRV